MDIRLIFVAIAASVVVAGLAFRRWCDRIIQGFKAALSWFLDFLLDGKTCHVLEQFFLESAVLWFVFPLLDSLYDKTKSIPPSLVHQAYLLAGIFLLFAVILSHAGER